MIICSCTVISDKDIRNIVEILKIEDEQQVITPGLVFKLLAKHPKCGTCIPNVIKVIQDKL